MHTSLCGSFSLTESVQHLPDAFHLALPTLLDLLATCKDAPPAVDCFVDLSCKNAVDALRLDGDKSQIMGAENMVCHSVSGSSMGTASSEDLNNLDGSGGSAKRKWSQGAPACRSGLEEAGHSQRKTDSPWPPSHGDVEMDVRGVVGGNLAAENSTLLGSPIPHMDASFLHRVLSVLSALLLAHPQAHPVAL